MPKARPSKRAERKAKEPATLPARFVPRFLADADQRQAVVKNIRRQIEQVKEETGCDCFIKETLIEEFIFLATMLATARVNALEGQPFDAGSYTQSVNALSGLATKLGLKRVTAMTLDLETYLERKVAKS